MLRTVYFLCDKLRSQDLFVHHFRGQNYHPVSVHAKSVPVVRVAISVMVLVQVFHGEGKHIKAHAHLAAQVANPYVQSGSGLVVRGQGTGVLETAVDDGGCGGG